MPTPGNPLRKVTAGEGLKSIPREVYNQIIDVISERSGAQIDGGDGTPRYTNFDPNIILALNDTGNDLAIGGIMEVDFDNAPIEATDNLTEYQARGFITGIVPSGDTDVPIVIALEPIADGEIGRVAISGLAPVLISMADPAHTRAVPSTNTTYLTSAEDGTLKIVHLSDAFTPGANQWAYVLLPGPMDSGLDQLRLDNVSTASYTDPFVFTSPMCDLLMFGTECGFSLKRNASVPLAAAVKLIPANSSQWGCVADTNQTWTGYKRIPVTILDDVYLGGADLALATNPCVYVYCSASSTAATYYFEHRANGLGSVISRFFTLSRDHSTRVATFGFTASAAPGSGAGHQGDFIFVARDEVVPAPSQIYVDGNEGLTTTIDGVGTFYAGLLISAGSGPASFSLPLWMFGS